jgi:predicted MFS family arabinose efflux permease
MAFMGMSGYLAVYLMQSYGMSVGETALPLTMTGLGVFVGSLLGGQVASRQQRFTVLALCFVGGGLAAALLFTLPVSLWLTVVLAFGVAALLLLSWPVTAVLLMAIAGQSRATATGLFAVSNQLGFMGGASLGGVVLSLGHFSLVGVFCLATAVAAAVIIRYKVQASGEIVQHAPVS